MPYDNASDSSLPQNVKDMPLAMRQQWVAVWNSAYKRCMDDGGEAGKCESSAFAQAHGVVNKRKEATDTSIVRLQFSGTEDPAIPTYIKMLPEQHQQMWVDLANKTFKDAATPDDKLPSKRYLVRLKDALKDLVKPTDFNKAIRVAAGHAGGSTPRKTKDDASSDTSNGNNNEEGEESEEGNSGEKAAIEPTIPLAFMYDDMMPADPFSCIIKFQKADKRINYREGTIVGQTCKDCEFYMFGACKIVEGLIDDDAVCDLLLTDGLPLNSAAGDGVSTTSISEDSTPFRTKNLVTICASDPDRPNARNEWRLYIDVSKSFAEGVVPDRINYLPKPGVYEHPKWGDVEITFERNKRFMDNFKNQVYQDRLPIDAEHQLKVSGATAWVTDMSQNSDGSVDATLEWTPRGRKLMSSGSFRYFSPEWWDIWKDPAEPDKTYNDIAIGGALTTRPYFKPKSLRSLVASEDGLSVMENEVIEDTGITYVFVPLTHKQASDSDNNSDSDSQVSSRSNEGESEVDEKTLKEFTDRLSAMEASIATLTSERDTLKAMSEASDSQVKAMSEVIAGMTAEKKSRVFSDIVDGKNSAGVKWVGDPTKHVTVLDTLSRTFGEESPEYTAYIEQQNITAQTVRNSTMFDEIGSDAIAVGGNNAAQQFEALVTKEMSEQGSDKDYRKAVSEVARKNPRLYSEYAESRQVRIG